jgi:hypothetical protein
VNLSKLDDWRNISSISNVSGTGTYTTMLNVPVSWLAHDRGAYLDLGAIDGSVQIFVNNRLVAPNATPDTAYTLLRPQIPALMGHFDVTPLLHAGNNQLRVVLSTTLDNAVVNAAHQGDTNVAAQTAYSATEPYGLLGPVQLQPYGRAVISLPNSIRAVAGRCRLQPMC